MELDELKKFIPESQNWTASIEITYGWSGEQKYQIKRSDGGDALLRILTPEQYEVQQDGIKFLLECDEISSLVPKLYAHGKTNFGEKYYLLLEFIYGENGMIAIGNYSDAKQYDLGVIMGKEIKKLHSQTEEKLCPKETQKFKEKTQRFLDYFISHKDKFKFLKNADEVIEDFLSIVDNRPMVMLHNDFHLGNMIIDEDRIFLIDFNRACIQDRFKEFDAIAWSAKCSTNFSAGLLDAYLEGEDKDEFFRILKGYISIWQIQMLFFIQDEDDDEKREVLDLIKFVSSWFEKDSNIPNWYIENSRVN